MSDWPDGRKAIKFWAVYQGPPHGWAEWGWVIYRSNRTGFVYYEELVLGGPMPDWLALSFLRGIKEMEAQHGA